MFTEIDLHVTNRCTALCKYCCFSAGRLPLPELGTEEWMDLIDRAAELGCRHVNFSGGEPLLREDLAQIAAHASGKGLRVRVHTNGMLLNEQKAQQLKDAGVSGVLISLDSTDRRIHDQNRGIGSWEAAVNAIRLAQNYFEKVRVCCVLTRDNMDTVFDTIGFVKKLGVRDFSALYFSPIGSGADYRERWIPPEEYLAFWTELQNRIDNEANYRDMNVVIEKAYAAWEESTQIDTSKFTGCGGGCAATSRNRNYLLVRCDGNVYPCVLRTTGKPLGNIRQNTLQWILRESPEWNVMQPLNEGNCTVSCEHYRLCGGGCRFYPGTEGMQDQRCIQGKLVPLCPIMKYNYINHRFGGSCEDVIK